MLIFLRGESFYNLGDKAKAIADYRGCSDRVPKSGRPGAGVYVLGATLEEKRNLRRQVLLTICF